MPSPIAATFPRTSRDDASRSRRTCTVVWLVSTIQRSGRRPGPSTPTEGRGSAGTSRIVGATRTRARGARAHGPAAPPARPGASRGPKGPARALTPWSDRIRSAPSARSRSARGGRRDIWVGALRGRRTDLAPSGVATSATILIQSPFVAANAPSGRSQPPPRSCTRARSASKAGRREGTWSSTEMTARVVHPPRGRGSPTLPRPAPGPSRRRGAGERGRSTPRRARPAAAARARLTRPRRASGGVCRRCRGSRSRPSPGELIRAARADGRSRCSLTMPGTSCSSRPIRTSNGSARSGTAPITTPSSSSAGRSSRGVNREVDLAVPQRVDDPVDPETFIPVGESVAAAPLVAGRGHRDDLGVNALAGDRAATSLGLRARRGPTAAWRSGGWSLPVGLRGGRVELGDRRVGPAGPGSGAPSGRRSGRGAAGGRCPRAPPRRPARPAGLRGVPHD